jgi:hypothetical protein
MTEICCDHLKPAAQTEDSAEMFCYHCRRRHPRSEMLLVRNKSGKRWRCRTSLRNARRQLAERDAFGQETTRNNRSDDKRLADLTNRVRSLSRWG